MPFAIRGIGKASKDIFLSEVGKIGEDLLVRHSCGKVGQDIVDRNSHPPDTGLPTALAGFNGDSFLIFHRDSIAVPRPRNKQSICQELDYPHPA